jgi:hypothetical protein
VIRAEKRSGTTTTGRDANGCRAIVLIADVSGAREAHTGRLGSVLNDALERQSDAEHLDCIKREFRIEAAFDIGLLPEAVLFT